MHFYSALSFAVRLCVEILTYATLRDIGLARTCPGSAIASRAIAAITTVVAAATPATVDNRLGFNTRVNVVAR